LVWKCRHPLVVAASSGKSAKRPFMQRYVRRSLQMICHCV
jgi:hypothetical protein